MLWLDALTLQPTVDRRDPRPEVRQQELPDDDVWAAAIDRAVALGATVVNISEVVCVPADRAAALEAAGGEAKVALVMLLAGVDAAVARTRLAAADGHVRQAAAG